MQVMKGAIARENLSKTNIDEKKGKRNKRVGEIPLERPCFSKAFSTSASHALLWLIIFFLSETS